MKNKRFIMGVIGLAVGQIMMVVGCSDSSTPNNLPVYNTPDLTPQWLSAKALMSDTIHRVRAFEFTNQDNQLVSNTTLDNKIYVANFMFTVCPSICPKMTQNLNAVQRAFEADPSVMLVSHTVMPWVDSVTQLKKYADNMGIKSQKWHLLTGDAGKIYNLARQSYFAEEAIGYTKDSTEFLHTEHVLLVDGKRRLRGIYNGTLQLDIERLIDDIHILKRE
jgi:protein SCO1